MRAIQLSQFGPPATSLQLVDIAEPAAPAAGQVLIEMEYAPINPNDLYIIRGVFTFQPPLPYIVGNEGVGRVIAIGEGVTTVKIGDRVAAPRYGQTLAERILARADDLFPLPDADVQQLAMLRINPTTAGLLLSQFVDLKPGDWVLQNAANSGVGRSVIALAKARGFRTINLVRRSELIPELQRAGGDIVLMDNEEGVRSIPQLVGRASVQLALDGVSGAAKGRLARVLAPGGILVGYAQMGGAPPPAGLPTLARQDITLTGFYQARPLFQAAIPPILHEAAQLIAEGSLHVPIAAIYPASGFKTAFARSEHGGKILIDLRQSAWGRRALVSEEAHTRAE